MSDQLKIPIVTGVNDNPIPPNFNGNRRGCNGSYVVDKHNKTVEVLKAATQLTSSQLNFSIVNLPSYLELGEPLTTLQNPLVFSYSHASEDLELYARYTHGDSTQSQTLLTGFKYPQNNLYEHTYIDTPNQPNTYTIPHTRVFGINLYESSTDFYLPNLSKYLEVSWLPKVIVGQSSVDNLMDFASLTSQVYNDFGVPSELLDITNTTEYTYVFLPRQTSGQTCYESLQSILIDKTGFVDVTPYSSNLTYTSTIGLNVEITYDVYKLPPNTEAYKLGLNFSPQSTYFVASTTNIITLEPQWSSTDW